MCCFLVVLAFFGPRLAILVWWLLDMTRWELAFSNFIWAFLGWLFAPWTTMAWVLVWSPSGLTGFDWVILALAIFLDISSYSSGWFGNRRRSESYA